jgi:hypothetical protein
MLPSLHMGGRKADVHPEECLIGDLDVPKI